MRPPYAELISTITTSPWDHRNSQPNGVIRSVDCVGYEAVNASGQGDLGIVMQNMVNVTAVGGGIGIVGDYESGISNFDIGQVFLNSLTVRGGPVLPLGLATELVALIRSGRASPSFIVSSTIGTEEAPEYYGRFNRREEAKVIIQFD
ncbi:hypothetical protein BJY01DRAFT_244085 [Aspergillus pseudoustus]|uniref:Alcohol dehydrogenase-like C-terminal domain-containing protein n=1 Tax=Aspergillus pseudoustus TaxID=1810923 RepID=A0ABR4KQD2_9EURO